MKREVVVESDTNALPETIYAILLNTPTWNEWTPFNEVTAIEEGDIGNKSGKVFLDHIGSAKKLKYFGISSEEKIVDLDQDISFTYTYVKGPLSRFMKDHIGVVELSREEDRTNICWRVIFWDKFLFSGIIPMLVLRGFLKKLVKGLAKYGEQ